MENKSRLIFGILIFILVPVFALAIWKELENNSKTGLEEGLNKKISLSSLSNQSSATSSNKAKSKTASVNPQSKPQSPDVPKVAAAENTAENKKEEVPKSDEKSDENNNADKNSYENKDLGISFDYPKEYAVAYDGNKVITISKGDISWKIRFYDDKDKSDIQTWFGNKFDKEDNLDCIFADPEIKTGTYEGKLVKSSVDKGKCAEEGNYATDSDKTKVVRIYEGTETKENINGTLLSFKFL